MRSLIFILAFLLPLNCYSGVMGPMVIPCDQNSVDASGGGACSSGTVIAGNNNIESTASMINEGVCYTPDATWAFSETATPATIEIYGAMTVTNNAKAFLLDSSGNQLCGSGATSVGESNAWNSFSLSGCSEIAADTAVLPMICVDGYMNIYVDDGSWETSQDGTYASPPDPAEINSGDLGYGNAWSWRLKC